MLQSNPEVLETVHRKLKALMVAGHGNRYLEFVRKLPFHEPWTYQANGAEVGYALVDKGNEIAMFDHFGDPEDVRDAARNLLVTLVDRGNSVVVLTDPEPGGRAMWGRIGFQQHESGNMVCDHRFGHVDEISVVGRNVPFSIRFFRDDVWRRQGAKPYAATEGTGKLTQLQEVHLPKRAIAFSGGLVSPEKTIVEIEVDGTLEYAGPLKADECFWIGAQREPSGLAYFKRIDLFTYKQMPVTAKPDMWMSMPMERQIAGRWSA